MAETEGFDLHFFPLGKNQGSHQCLHWWQQLSTGQLLCYGFESLITYKIRPTRRWVLFYGGDGGIRTLVRLPAN